MIPAPGRNRNAHSQPVGQVVRTGEDVGKDDLEPRRLEGSVDHRVVLGVDVFDDAENPVLDVYRPEFTVDITEIGNIVAHNLFARKHGRRGLAAR